MPDLSLLSWTEISCCTRTNMSDALSDDGHGFWRFCPRDVSAYSLVCGIDGLGLILWTPRLREWSRLVSLSRRPELTWGHASADPRNSAAFEGPSHLSSILPIFLRLQRSVLRKSGKCELRNYNSAELRNQWSYEAYLHFHFREATSTNSLLASLL